MGVLQFPVLGSGTCESYEKESLKDCHETIWNIPTFESLPSVFYSIATLFCAFVTPWWERCWAWGGIGPGNCIARWDIGTMTVCWCSLGLTSCNLAKLGICSVHMTLWLKNHGHWFLLSNVRVAWKPCQGMLICVIGGSFLAACSMSTWTPRIQLLFSPQNRSCQS